MKKWIVVLMLTGVFAFTAFAEDPAPKPEAAKSSTAGKLTADDKLALAKAAQNPVSDMINLPFQWNVGFDTGPDNHTSSVLNIQPVIPFNLSEDWNLITRTIVPVVNQPPVGALDRKEWGLANVQFAGFLSPKDTYKGWIWGAGPIFEFPPNTSDILASDNYSVGPTFVALRKDGPWVYGGLINQLWSFYGDDQEVNKMLIQPFVNYNMDDGWYLTSGRSSPRTGRPKIATSGPSPSAAALAKLLR